MRLKFSLAALILVLLAGCSSTPAKFAFSDLPANGDATRGAEIFTKGVGEAPACATCHRTDGVMLVGPGLGGFASRAATRVSGLSAREYAFQSIIAPARYLVSGFTNLMYDKYGDKLSAQDTADIIAYLMQLN
jgi:cytochrome c553